MQGLLGKDGDGLMGLVNCPRNMDKPRAVDSSYRALGGCHSCGHAFRRTEYDEGDEFFCHRDRTLRPQCFSVQMDECPDSDDKLRDDWDDWADMHRVEAWGVCSYYTPETK